MTDLRLLQTESLQMTILKWIEMEVLQKGRKTRVGKGEIALLEQFLHFLQCFQKNLNCRHVKTRACLGKD